MRIKLMIAAIVASLLGGCVVVPEGHDHHDGWYGHHHWEHEHYRW